VAKSGVRHPLSPVIRLGLRNPRKKERKSNVAGSKRRALAFCFSVRIWYIFLVSICKGKSDQGVCMTSILAKRMRPHSADFQFKNVFGRRISRKSALRSRVLFTSTEVKLVTPRHSNILAPSTCTGCLRQVRSRNTTQCTTVINA